MSQGLQKESNKCYFVSKTVPKMQKLEGDFQSKQLKKILYGDRQKVGKKPINSKSTLILNRNHIQHSRDKLRSQPRSIYKTPQKLPFISQSSKNKKALSNQNLKIKRQFPLSDTSQPILQKYENNKLESPIMKSIVGKRFNSKQQLKQLLFNHFQRQKQQVSETSASKNDKQQSPERYISKQERKEMNHNAQGVLAKIDQIINPHHSPVNLEKQTNGKQQKEPQKVVKRICSQLSNYEKIKISADWIQFDNNMEVFYCMLSSNSHSDKRSRNILMILHDAVCSFMQYLITAANLVSNQISILLLNYPGQAHTTFGTKKLTGPTFSLMMDRLMYRLHSQKVLNAQNDKFCFCGIGYGGYLLRYYLNMNYRYYPNWNAVMFINSPIQISLQYQKFIKKFKQRYDLSSTSRFQAFYKQFYGLEESFFPFCRQMNEISDLGIDYLLSSSIEQSNQPIELKCSKLKILNKCISANSEQKSQRILSKMKLTTNSVQVSSGNVYSGKQAVNYSFISSERFESILQKFILKNF